MQQIQSGTRVQAGTADRPIAQVKTCPRCGARLFADMDVCYGCLYDFTRTTSAAPVLPESEGPVWADEVGAVADDDPIVRMPAEPSAPPGMTGLDAIDLDECWDAPPDQTVFLGAPAPEKVHLGLLVRSSSMDVMLPLERQGVTVGRGEDNDVVLHMRTVSRSHLRLVPQGESVLVLDQGAINLAHANGLPVEGQCQVGIGGCIDICGVRMSVVGLDG